MSNEAKYTPLRVLAIRTDPAEGMDGWWLNIWGQNDYGGNIGWLNGGDENAERTAQLERAVNSYEATQRLLDECESFLTRINQLASPDPERTFDNAITDLGYIADYARTALAAISEHRKAKP